MILRLAVTAVLGALCAMVLKRREPELAFLLSIAAGVLLLGMAVSALSEVRACIDLLAQAAELSDEVLSPLLKTVGIAILARISAELCRDAGEGGLGVFAELAGSAAAIVAAAPLLRGVLTAVTQLL